MNNKDLIKKLSYLKGLTDGIKLSEKSDEGKVIAELIDMVEALTEQVEELSERIDDAEDSIDEIDECLCAVSDDLDDLYAACGSGVSSDYDDFDDDEDDDYDFDYDDDDDDSELFELECPNCGEDVMIDFDMLDEDSSIVCPNCRKEI